ncbi:hypothetical protein LTR16_010635, partial [Cryomyces antarcticus]
RTPAQTGCETRRARRHRRSDGLQLAAELLHGVRRQLHCGLHPRTLVWQLRRAGEPYRAGQGHVSEHDGLGDRVCGCECEPAGESELCEPELGVFRPYRLHHALLLLRLLPLLRVKRRPQRRDAEPRRQADGHRLLVSRRRCHGRRAQGQR